MLIRSTRTPYITGRGTHDYRHCLEFCSMHCVELVVMKTVYFVFRNRYYFRVLNIRIVYICEYTSLYLGDHGRYFVKNTFIEGLTFLFHSAVIRFHGLNETCFSCVDS